MYQTCPSGLLVSVMLDSESDSGVTLLLAGIEIGIKKIKLWWNRNQRMLRIGIRNLINAGIGIGMKMCLESCITDLFDLL